MDYSFLNLGSELIEFDESYFKIGKMEYLIPSCLDVK